LGRGGYLLKDLVVEEGAGRRDRVGKRGVRHEVSRILSP
jgi:hypothetical protein